MTELNSLDECGIVFDQVNEMETKIADYIIDVLHKLGEEYDVLVKNARQVFQMDQFPFEVKQRDVNKARINAVDCATKLWDENNLSIQLSDLQEMVRVVKKEKQVYLGIKSLLEKRYDSEKMKVETLNKEIKEVSITEIDQSVEEQLKTVVDDLDRLLVAESIYPNAIEEINNACTLLQYKVEEIEKKFEKYHDLPSDYEKARAQLMKAKLYDTELEIKIRNAIHKN